MDQRTNDEPNRLATTAGPIAPAIAVAVAGIALTAALAMAFGMSWGQTLQLAGVAGVAATAAILSGALALALLRRRSLGLQFAVVALASIAAVAAGMLAGARIMLFAGHEVRALMVMLAAVATGGLLTSIALGVRVRSATEALGGVVRSIGEAEMVKPSIAPKAAEFAVLAGELDTMRKNLDEARSRERAMESARRELVAWVSHDLRTPLATIRAVAEALDDGVIAEPQAVRGYYSTLREEADRLTDLVDDLFELSRIEAGALQLQTANASLGDLVSDAVAAASVVARARSVRLEGRMNEQVPVMRLSTREVSRALHNVLDNAIRHTPPLGHVRVEAGAEGADAYVRVLDACGGIPEPDLDRVFDLAFRGEPSRTPIRGGGAGLGLAIARGIVEAHNGSISVQNENGGCRFTLRFPLSGPDAEGRTTR